MAGMMKDDQLAEIAAELYENPVCIAWSKFWVVRKAHAVYLPLWNRILVSDAYQHASPEALRCLVAHELGHARDGALRFVLWGYLVSGLLMVALNWLYTVFAAPIVGWAEMAAVFTAAGFAYLLASKRIFPWEKRADDWAIARVGEDIYWTTKEEIRAVTLWRK
ncbi:hypothetical protein [Acidithiobacillus ferriphilus]|uniref:hypothetical protein n=2 Tax=Acidithiobacillus ferriphilus TaxID=1689834 RepID=UPI001C0730D7|nr:hypothetical protein [Acidithiobacillus ferriphilus]